MELKNYTLVNEQKVHRAIFGTLARGGVMVGGIGEGEGEEWEKKLLAEYDRLGGLIKRGDDPVKKGCFYNFKGKAPHAEPTVMLVFHINGKTVEVSAEEPLPPLVRAAKEAEKGATGDADTLADMTLAELKDYAADKNIDLGNAKTKAAVLAAIRGESEDGRTE